MKNLQKIIATITILGLLLSPTFNIFSFKPKQVQAVGSFGSILTAVKELVLDAIGWSITDRVLKWLETKILDWGMGRNTTKNEPFPVLDWNKFFDELLDKASAKFVQKFKLTPLCAPISISLGTKFSLTQYNSDLRYEYVAACTLGDVVDNVENFLANPKITFNSSQTWGTLMSPQNNLFGSWLMALEERERMEEEETKAGDKETAVSSGIKNETVTTKTDVQACYDGCNSLPMEINMPLDYYDQMVDQCKDDCEVTTKGITIQQKVKNTGDVIHRKLEDALSKDMQRVISADEISELLGVLFSAVLNKAINGLGLFFTPKTATKTEQNRAKTKDAYTYLKEFKKKQTGQQVKDIYNNVATSIYSGIQSLNRSIISCDDEDKMMNSLEYSRNLSDIFNAEVEALYTGVDGVNLKTDWLALDPGLAPFPLYGYSWGEVPAAKIPEKCHAIINQAYNQFKGGVDAPSNATCRNIVSNLETKTPTLADLQDTNPITDTNPGTEWTTDPPNTSSCAQCMYDHDALNCPPAPYPPQVYSATTDPYAGTYNRKGDFYNACRRWYNITSDRCDECLKKVDEKCGQESEETRKECIAGYCNNYEEIANRVILPLPVPVTASGSLDFYNRCLIEEKKDACYTCLREYFMPSFYCGEINDYMARAIVKYPTVVISNNNPDSVGRDAGSNTCNIPSANDIEVDLICRIMPDFKYGNSAVCQNCFNGNPPMTQKELADIVDFRPNGADCGNQKLRTGGGVNTWGVIKYGQLSTLSKCCGALWYDDYVQYMKCVGAGAELTLTPICFGQTPTDAPQCYCEEGWRPIAGKHLALNFKCPDGVCPVPEDPTCRSSCEEAQFEVPNMNLRDRASLSTNVVTGGSFVYVSLNSCDDPDYAACRQTAQRTFFENLARIFKPLFKPHIPYANAFGICNCWIEDGQCMYEEPLGSGQEALCNVSEYCDTNPATNGACSPQENPVDPSRPAMEGIRKFAGNCDCDSTAQCAGGEYCDLPIQADGLIIAPCTPGEHTGLCKQGQSGPCDYIAGVPADTVCSIQTPHGNGATDCCFSGGEEGPTFPTTIECDLSGRSVGEVLRVGVANERTTDCNTGALLCVQCNESDPNYNTGGAGFYNTGKQQCYEKVVW